MLFMLRHVHEIFAVCRQIHFLWTPEERKLFFNQLFKDWVFLFIVTGNVDAAAKKHRFARSVM